MLRLAFLYTNQDALNGRFIVVSTGGIVDAAQFWEHPKMKVLFNSPIPAMLTHGGTQIQLERTMAALEAIGVETERLQWWNAQQDGQILHQFCSCPPSLLSLAQAKGWKVVATVLLTETCNRSRLGLLLRGLLVRGVFALGVSGRLGDFFPWHAYRTCDHLIVGLQVEKEIVVRMWGVPPERVTVVPLGLSNGFLNAGHTLRTENHLICTGRIDPAKNSLELAHLAREAQVPLLFVGKPMEGCSDYWEQFRQLIDNKYVKHHSYVREEQELIKLLRTARGYVLMSRFENWSLAAHEAVACGLPLLLPDQRWARERFGTQASYFPRAGRRGSVLALRKFYDDCPRLRAPEIKLHNWTEVAEQLKQVYQKALEPQRSGLLQTVRPLNANVNVPG